MFSEVRFSITKQGPLLSFKNQIGKLTNVILKIMNKGLLIS